MSHLPTLKCHVSGFSMFDLGSPPSFRRRSPTGSNNVDPTRLGVRQTLVLACRVHNIAAGRVPNRAIMRQRERQDASAK